MRDHGGDDGKDRDGENGQPGGNKPSGNDDPSWAGGTLVPYHSCQVSSTPRADHDVLFLFTA
jgi:hypothetical protein